jgi:hypothetical protein
MNKYDDYEGYEEYDDEVAEVEEVEEDEGQNDEIEEIAKQIEPDEGSILDDETALSALRLLKQVLYEKGCKLADFRIGFDPSGFDIKGLKITCSDPQQILDALKDVETLPGQLKPQSQYDKQPNSYTISAVLADLKQRSSDELGLDVRAIGYQNDYVVLSFFPGEQEPEPEPEMPEMPEIPPVEEMPEEGEEEIPPEGEAEEEEGEEALEEIPVEEVDWEAVGL